MSSAKRWVYTINNYKEEYPLEEESSYHVYGREVGENGTPHLQGFIIFKNRKRLTQLQKLLPGGHYEVARGKNQQASDYCKKSGDFVEIGTLPMESNERGGLATKIKWDKIKQQAMAGDLLDIDSEAC